MLLEADDIYLQPCN